MIKAMISVGLAVAVCLGLPASGRADSAAQSADLSFIDAHVHLNDPDRQLALMVQFAIPRAVVFWGRNSSNEKVSAAAQRHPDRFIPFASISPERSAYRQKWETGDPSILAELESLVASGAFRGIGEISVAHFPSPGFPETAFDPLSPVMTGIMALAQRYRLPVMIHCEITYLREFETLLTRFRDVSVIWAHGGYTPLFLAARLIQAHPNLYYELSARTWPVHPRSPDYTILHDGRKVWPDWLKLIEAQSERFLVGTDSSGRSTESDAAKAASVQAFLQQLSPAARRNVASDTLLRLIGELR